ncbi:S8 family serine peptidase [Candidatus Uhrbacteria bacterium]|nr:S8 family serine peptidase [Candidatus Uhrbacteria bacterium]
MASPFRSIGHFVGMVCVMIAVPGVAHALVPNDIFVAQQWYLDRIAAPDAWEVTTGNERSIVAVLDVGVDVDHPDLVSAIWTNPGEIPGNAVDDDQNGLIDDVHGWDFIGNDADPTPAWDIAGSSPRDLHHGTLVAGIIAARGNNGIGVAGIDWKAKIMPFRVLHSDGTGDVEVVLAAFRYAVAKGATVINLSFVGDQRSTELDTAIADAEQRGVIVVAAGGNEDRRGQGDLDQFPVYPICAGMDGHTVLGVAATTMDDAKASFSSYGRCVDISAPGERIVGTLFHDPGHVAVPVGGAVTPATFTQPYGGFFSGTSFAAPIISGVVSLIRGVLPRATPAQVGALLARTADPIQGTSSVPASRMGAGRVNLARALAAATEEAHRTPSAAQSRIVAAVPLASVGERVRVHVEVHAADGGFLVGRVVTLRSLRPSDTLTPIAPTTDAQGVATFDVQAQEEGIAELVATVEGEEVGRGRAVFARATTAPIGPGSLLRGSASTVYLVASDGKRYVFPDAQTFRSWYADAHAVQRVGDVVLAAFPLGGLVSVRPGTFLAKITTDPKVYAIEPGGALRWIPDEAIALAIYGQNWSQRVVDIPDAFFPIYHIAEALPPNTIPDRTLLEEEQTGERYLVDRGQRHHLTSMLALLKNGLQLRDVVRVPRVTLPDGAPIVDRELALASPVP